MSVRALLLGGRGGGGEEVFLRGLAETPPPGVTYAMILVTLLLSLLTILLATLTITRELEYRQIFLTMSKPVSRGQYLLGKWLGLAVLNALLVSVSGVAIYTYTRLIADQPAMNLNDVLEAREEVLTARRSIKPMPDDPQLLPGHRAWA